MATEQLNSGTPSRPSSTRRTLTLAELCEGRTAVPRVTVSHAGRIALALADHRITTTTGYFDGVSRAWCSCEQWRTTVASRDLSVVRLAARHHRRTELQAVFAWES